MVHHIDLERVSRHPIGYKWILKSIIPWLISHFRIVIPCCCLVQKLRSSYCHSFQIEKVFFFFIILIKKENFTLNLSKLICYEIFLECFRVYKIVYCQTLVIFHIYNHNPFKWSLKGFSTHINMSVIQLQISSLLH